MPANLTIPGKLRLGIVFSALCLLTVSCADAEPSPRAASSIGPTTELLPPQITGGGGVKLDWTSPVPGGVPLADPSDADLAFRPDVPRGLRIPTVLEASDPADPEDIVADREIGWVFDHPQYGRFWVVQYLVDASLTVSEWVTEAGIEPGCRTDGTGGAPGAPPPLASCTFGEGSLVPVGDGALGYLEIGDSVRSYLEWVQPPRQLSSDAVEGFNENPALLVLLMGPVETFDAETAFAIVEQADFEAVGPIGGTYTTEDCAEHVGLCVDRIMSHAS